MSQSRTTTAPARLRASLVLLLLAALGGGLGGNCGGGGTSPPPRVAGLPEFQQLALRPVPGAGAVVNVVARNLLVFRTDLSLDTRLGTHNLGATYNAATGAWLWTFDITYDGATFVDDTGARFDTSALAPGEAIPGTHWVVVDGATLKTKGGLVHAFDAAGRLAAVRWASASWPRIVFVSEPVAGAPHTTRIDQCTAPDACTGLFSLTYDVDGRLVGVADRAGRQAAFTYDADGRLATARDGLDTEKGWPGFRYEYIGGKIAAITNSEGERVEYRFTSRRLEVEAIGAEHPLHVVRYAGTSNGLHTTEHTDPEGHVLRYRWDGQRRLHALESVDTGETLALSWSGLRPVERVLPDGTTTTWTYTGDDVATETQPSGNVVSFTYAPDAVDRANPRGRPVARIEDTLGLVEERSYDAAGRLVATTNGAGETTTFAYGSDEMLARRTGPAGVVTGFGGYGEHGHPTEITRSGADASATRVYDAVGNLLELRGEIDIGGVARREYDADRNVAEVHLRGLVDGDQGPVEILTVEHRSDGRQTRILRPHGDDAEFVYDALGRLVERREKADGVWRATTFEPDALGRVTATQRPNGMRQETTYDALGREKTRTIGRGNPIAVESTATFTYENGRRVEILDSVHGEPEQIAYDAAGRPEAIRYPGGEVLQLAYDLRSRVTAATFWKLDSGFARTVELAYDGAGREVAVTDAGQVVLRRAHAAGRLAETRYGNGLVRTYGYAEDGMLLSAETVDASRSVVESSWSTTGFFWVSSVNNLTETPGGLIGATGASYALSPQQGSSPRSALRVSEAWLPTEGAITPEGPIVDWAYDALGNVTHTDVSTLGGEAFAEAHYAYNAEHNRLQRVDDSSGAPQHTYTYDEAGYVIERDGVPFSWDGAGRIAAIGAEGTFAWDTLGRPVSSTILGVPRTHLFGGLMKADELGNPLTLDLGEVKIDLGTGARRYRHLDFRGNVAFVTDDTGTIVAQYQYSAYGVEVAFGDPDEGPSFARGRALGGLVLLGHRVLDRDAARFLAPDPIYQLINQYAYAFGNPINFWDPSGLEAESTSGEDVVAATAKATLTAALGVLVAKLSNSNLVAAAVALFFEVGTGVGAEFVGENVIGPTIPDNPRVRSGGNIRAPLMAPSPIGPLSGIGFDGLGALDFLGGPRGNMVGKAVGVPGSSGGGGAGGGCSPAALPGGAAPFAWVLGVSLVNLALLLYVLKRALQRRDSSKEPPTRSRLSDRKSWSLSRNV